MQRKVLIRLAALAKESRVQAGVLQLEVAHRADIHRSGVSRFEANDGRPRDLDRLIEAYEDECNLERGTLWRRAVDP